MYSWQSVGTAFRYPRRALVELHGLYKSRFGGGPDGVKVLSQDWDNLVILDACRYDLFEDVNHIPGRLEAVDSLGTHTGEFMERNFGGGSFDDIVFVSANPTPSEHDISFHGVEHLWEDHWDEELHTVHPKSVTEQALAAQSEYPNKRLIIHYLQPHYPFIGQAGRQFHDREGYTMLDESNNVWMRLRRGELSKQHIWELYRENLEVTLPHVERLVEGLRGRTVVTSDHGNAFGEMDVYGHPSKTYIEPLQRVPWLVVTHEVRKTVEGSATTQPVSTPQQDMAEERLRELGYVD